MKLLDKITFKHSGSTEATERAMMPAMDALRRGLDKIIRKLKRKLKRR